MVAGVCPIQKPFVMVTSCAVFSSSAHWISPKEQPIENVPEGIQTYRWPSFGFVLRSPGRGGLSVPNCDWPVNPKLRVIASSDVKMTLRGNRMAQPIYN